MNYLLIALLSIITHHLTAQINAESYNLTIETKLSDTLQHVYENFLNSSVSKVSIVRLNKKYDLYSYDHFLETKNIFQSSRKWKKENSREESIIVEGATFPWKHFDSIVFMNSFLWVEKEFIKSEYFLDSTETKLALTEMFNGAENDMMAMCYNPRHAVLFYNTEGEISGIYEICFECDNVTIGIYGTITFARLCPYLESLFAKYEKELR